MDVSTIYSLRQMGRVRLTRPVSYCRACMVHVSLKTIEAHGYQHVTMLSWHARGTPAFQKTEFDYIS